MTNKLKITLNVLSLIILASSSFTVGYLLSKKKYLAKKINGDLYLNYEKDHDSPSIYLSVDQSTLVNTPNYAILKVITIRK